MGNDTENCCVGFPDCCCDCRVGEFTYTITPCGEDYVCQTCEEERLALVPNHSE